MSNSSKSIAKNMLDTVDVAAADAPIDFLKNAALCELDNVNEEDSLAAALTKVGGGACYEDYRIGQYAQSATHYSSQYGSYYSISYTANNIVGRPTKFPHYGDFPETFAMRTYGNWWHEAPSRIIDFQPQNFSKIKAHDFIVMQFEEYVLPDEIAIFETFNPGAVVRIWAYTIVNTWSLLWEVDDFQHPQCVAQRSRKFSPTLKRLNLPTKIIRLEFNHTHLNYLTEIDAVLLFGRHINESNLQQLLLCYEHHKNRSIVNKLRNMQFRPNFKDNYQSRLQEFLQHDLNKFVAVIKPEDVEVNTAAANKVGLKDMPFEILLKIFGFLDLKTLFRIGQVSQYFYDVSTHPLLYCDVNLKPYWHLASNDLLCTLAKRATLLKKLDLSWCGIYESITSTEFKKFIQQRGDNLTHLRLNSCEFLNSTCIDTLGIVCDNLKELSLRNCTPLVNCTCLANLKNLERLDLYQTVLEPLLLLTMLESNRKLKHLNLAFYDLNMDEVAQHIGNYNQQLVSLDMWKSQLLSAVGVLALSNCHDLEEVDFGWCLREASLGDSLKQLVMNCSKLKKLFLATARGITDSDVESIANNCKNLEQLDLMGVSGISNERYFDILTKCTKLKLLDLSFCDNIFDGQIPLWNLNFDVNIKCSDVPLNAGDDYEY